MNELFRGILVGHKLKLLSHEVHAHLIHNLYLAHLRMTYELAKHENKEVRTTDTKKLLPLCSNSGLANSQVIHKWLTIYPLYFCTKVVYIVGTRSSNVYRTCHHSTNPGKKRPKEDESRVVDLHRLLVTIIASLLRSSCSNIRGYAVTMLACHRERWIGRLEKKLVSMSQNFFLRQCHDTCRESLLKGKPRYG